MAVNEDDAAKSTLLVRDYIARTESPRSLRAIDATYEAPRFYRCGARMAVSYKLKNVLEDGGVMFGGDRLYFVSLGSGRIEEVNLGE